MQLHRQRVLQQPSALHCTTLHPTYTPMKSPILSLTVRRWMFVVLLVGCFVIPSWNISYPRCVGASPLDTLLFSYTTKVIQWGNASSSLQIGDLPILPANMRAVYNYEQMKNTLHNVSMNILPWSGFQRSGLILAFQLLRLNISVFALLFILSTIIPFTAYIPPFFLRKLVNSLEHDPERKDKSWGWVYVLGLFSGQVFAYLSMFTFESYSEYPSDWRNSVNGQVFSLAGTITQTRLKIQLGSVLYAKTLLLKDAVSVSQSNPERNAPNGKSPLSKSGKAAEDFSSKTQIMNLMTTDADRAAESIGRIFMLICKMSGFLLLF